VQTLGTRCVRRYPKRSQHCRRLRSEASRTAHRLGSRYDLSRVSREGWSALSKRCHHVADQTSAPVISLVALRSEWRREAARTNLWLVPMIEVVVAVALYLVTRALDKAAVSGSITLPSWMVFGTADAARQMLTTLAAAVIAVVGIVFSIMIVTLALASTQFGPRMLRNFIRDRGTQFTLGTFVATFVYATLVLISIGPGTSGKDFVPHLSITTSVGLVTVSMAVLI